MRADREETDRDHVYTPILEHVTILGVKFTLSVAMCRPAQLTELARAAQECGYAAIALPDSIFYSETAAAAYPYTPDGSRFWTDQTPWFDPLIAAAAMAQVTTTLRFYTQVLKLGPRSPLLLEI